MKIDKNISGSYPWGEHEWSVRTRAVAEAIPAGCSVLDLGGGLGHLFKYLRGCKRYTSFDMKPWTDRTILADFNRGEYPDIRPKFQVAVAQGIIEYVTDVKEFLTKAKGYASVLVITYRPKQRPGPMSIDELKEWLKKSGWSIVFGKHISPGEVMFYCSHA
jgi:hypothetical protein